MKKFNRILEQYVRENESLTRIRLKVDPKDTSGIDFRDFDGYEGYILKEGKYFNVLIEGMDFPIMQVPFSIIKVVDIKDKNTFDRVKVAAIEKLNNIKDITPELIDKFKACNSVNFFEEFLKEEGLSDSDIKDIYKKYIFADTFSEAVNWGNVGNSIKKAYQTGKKAGQIGLGVLFPTKGAEMMFNWLNEPVNGQSGKIKSNNTIATRYRNVSNKLPLIRIPSTAALSVSATITNPKVFTFEPAFDAYVNKGTNDVIIIKPANKALNIQAYNAKYIDINNPKIDSRTQTKLEDYFITKLPNPPEITNPSIYSKSVFEIAGASPLLSGTP